MSKTIHIGPGLSLPLEAVTQTFGILAKRGAGKTYSLDRIDVDGNYEPGNVRWATVSEQARNRRNSIVIEHNGKRAQLDEWEAITGIRRATLWNRVKLGWSAEATLTTPLRPSGPKRKRPLPSEATK